MTNLLNEVIGHEKALTTITLLVFAWSTKSSVYQMTLLECKCVCVWGGGGGGEYATIIMDVQSLVYVVKFNTLICYYALIFRFTRGAC